MGWSFKYLLVFLDALNVTTCWYFTIYDRGLTKKHGIWEYGGFSGMELGYDGCANCKMLLYIWTTMDKYTIIVIYTFINGELSIYSKIWWGSSTCSHQLQGGIHWGYTLWGYKDILVLHHLNRCFPTLDRWELHMGNHPHSSLAVFHNSYFQVSELF